MTTLHDPASDLALRTAETTGVESEAQDGLLDDIAGMDPVIFTRWRNLIRANRENPHKEKFTMEKFMHPCGTPACLLGNYAARRDLQSDVLFDGEVLRYSNGELPLFDGLGRLFRLDFSDALRCFDSPGCNGAKTTDDALDYIHAFLRPRLSTAQRAILERDRLDYERGKFAPKTYARNVAEQRSIMDEVSLGALRSMEAMHDSAKDEEAGALMDMQRPDRFEQF